MKYRADLSWFRVVAVLGTALVMELTAPGQARAGCGDYVRFGSEQGKHTGSMPEGVGHIPNVPGQQPCRGPQCRGNHAPMPAPVFVAPHAAEAACLVEPVSLAGASRDWLNAPYLNAAPVRHPHSIFHPPREV